MAEDIGIELHDKIKQAFDARCGKDSTLSHIKRKIENGTATMEDTSVYARRLGELLRKSIESTTKPDDLPGEKMYFNIAQSILEPLLRNNYDDVNTICEEVQSALDAKKGIGLKPQKADFPAERIRAAIGGAAVKETAEHAIQVLGRTAENITGSFQTDYIKKNAEFRSKAGLNCYIERKDGHNCCDWCSKLAGKYHYPDEVPKDVYRRHDNCTCDVSYVSEKGRQNVHSKQWANEQAKAQRIAYAASLPKPMKLTKAEAIAKQSEILARRELTFWEKSDIIYMKKDSSSDSIQWLPRRERISIKQYQEVREYALSNGINLQGFKTSDVDIDLVKESIASIKEVTDTFPELLGSGRKKLTLSLSNTMSDEDFALSYEHLPHLIYLNGNAYRDATKLEAEYQKLVNDKWFVQGTDRKSIVKHELGHLYQSIHGITDEEIVSIALKSGHFNSREELFEFLSANLSIYSSEYLDGSEIISEVFSDYFSNSRPLDFSSNFIEELKKTK